MEDSSAMLLPAVIDWGHYVRGFLASVSVLCAANLALHQCQQLFFWFSAAYCPPGLRVKDNSVGRALSFVERVGCPPRTTVGETLGKNVKHC